MKEVKQPKLPLAYFYLIVLLLLFLFNAENQEIGKVQIQSNQIIFTNKDESQLYRTGLMEDPGLVERLHASGAEFTSEIVEQASPLATFLLSWLLPIGVFVILGQFLSKKMMDKAGGGAGSLMFNMGKSNAKIYVKSSDGIRFSDVEGVDEAEENLQEIVEYLENPQKYSEIGAQMPKGVLLVGPPGTGKTMRHGRVQGARPVSPGQGESPLHRLYRRNRRHRAEAQRRQPHRRK